MEDLSKSSGDHRKSNIHAASSSANITYEASKEESSKTRVGLVSAIQSRRRTHDQSTIYAAPLEGSPWEEFGKKYAFVATDVGHGHFGPVRLALDLKKARKKAKTGGFSADTSEWLSNMLRANQAGAPLKTSDIEELYAANCCVAVKVIYKDEVAQSDPDLLATRVFNKEAGLLKAIRSKHVVQFMDFYENDLCFFCVTEFITGGTLTEYIAQKEYITELDVRDIIKSMIYALVACHEKGVCHRDIKPENILLRVVKNPRLRSPIHTNSTKASAKSQLERSREKEEFSDSLDEVLNLEVDSSEPRLRSKIIDSSPGLKLVDGHLEVVLCDFGFSRQVPVKQRRELSEDYVHLMDESVTFMAPEIFTGDFDTRCDTWSLGMVTYLLLSGGNAYPFDLKPEQAIDESVENITDHSLRLNFGPQASWKIISNDAKKFVKSCLERQVDKRAFSSRLIAREWFKASTSELSGRVIRDLQPLKRFNQARREQEEAHAIEVHEKQHQEEIKRLKSQVATVQLDNNDAEAMSDLLECEDVVYSDYERFFLSLLE